MREQERRARRHSRWLTTIALVSAVVAMAALGFAWVAGAQPGALFGEPATTIAPAPTTTLPGACAEALALANDLAAHSAMLADAGIDHGVLMEKLELFLDGKPGGLNGQQVYQLGKQQVKVMEDHGPDVRATIHRYQEARRQCPIH